METVVIDAYNLLHKISELRPLLAEEQDIVVDTLLAKIVPYFYGKGPRVVVVFDGAGKNRHQGNIDVKFAYSHVGNKFENADQLIKNLIERARNPKLLKIVTNDNEIKNFARECGCRLQSLNSFWDDLREKRSKRIAIRKEENEKPSQITKGEIEFFLKAFNSKKK